MASTRGLVVRNTLYLMGAQIIGTPLSIAVNAVMGRYLEAADFGRIYLASTMSQLGFVFVDWGQNDFLPGAIARDRTRAGEWLGATLAWRCMAALLMSGILTGMCVALHYEREIFVTLFLIIVQHLCGSLCAGLQNTIRGFERSDIGAVGQIGQQLLLAGLVVPTLVLGGRLRSTLLAQAAAALITLLATYRVLRSLGVGSRTFGRETLRELALHGAPFLMFSVVMMLQSNVDAVLLSKLSNEEVVGWHAVAKRLIGAVVMPAGALVSALYPTLSRLHAQADPGFLNVTRGALRSAAALCMPLALCCYLYGSVGVRIFGEASFGPAEGNLKVLSAHVWLMYFSMPIGVALLASGKQRAWAMTQLLCVVVSAVLDPILIPWTQARYHNGGLGVCIAAVVSEVAMVGIGIALGPTGLIDAALFKQLGKVAAAGAAMLGAAKLMAGLSPLLAAPLSVAIYGCVLAATGGVDPQQLQAIRAAVRRRTQRV